jgi:hypothetical protein
MENSHVVYEFVVTAEVGERCMVGTGKEGLLGTIVSRYPFLMIETPNVSAERTVLVQGIFPGPPQGRRKYEEWSQEKQQAYDNKCSNGNLQGLQRHFLEENLSAEHAGTCGGVSENEDRKQAMSLSQKT